VRLHRDVRQPPVRGVLGEQSHEPRFQHLVGGEPQPLAVEKQRGISVAIEGPTSWRSQRGRSLSNRLLGAALRVVAPIGLSRDATPVYALPNKHLHHPYKFPSDFIYSTVQRFDAGEETDRFVGLLGKLDLFGGKVTTEVIRDVLYAIDSKGTAKGSGQQRGQEPFWKGS